MEEFKLSGTTTIGERGQVVIPAQVREELGLKAGDKLLVFSPRKGIVCLVEPKEFEKQFERMASRIRDFRAKLKEDK